MFRSFILILYFLSLATLNVFAQEIIWSNEFEPNSNENNEYANKIINTSDNGFAVVGAECFSLYQCFSTLLKLNNNGELVFKRIYDQDSRINDVLQTDDGGFILVGWISLPQGHNFYAIKTDSLGNEIWSENWSLSNNANFEALKVIESDDDGFIIAGNNITNGSFLIIKVDSSGNLLWQTNEQIFNLQTTLASIFIQNDNNYIITGHVLENGGRFPFYSLLNIQTGNILASSVDGGLIEHVTLVNSSISYDNGSSWLSVGTSNVSSTSMGLYVIQYDNIFYSNSSSVNPQGFIQESYFGTDDLYYFEPDIIKNSNGDIFISATEGFQNTNASITKLDSDLNEIWSESISILNSEVTACNSITFDQQNNIVITGNVTSTLWSENQNIFVAKIANGQNGCTDSLAVNYNADANNDDGSCIDAIYGCTDSLALNFDSFANTNDESCLYGIDGCMDYTACNFNPDATLTLFDECIYPEYGYDCSGLCLFDEIPIAYYQQSYDFNVFVDVSYSNQFDQINSSNLELHLNNPFVDTAFTIDSEESYSPDGDWFQFDDQFCGMYQPYMIWLNSPSGCSDTLELITYSNQELDFGNDINSNNICDGLEISGCTDSTALNYDFQATLDDGSCQYCEYDNLLSNYDDSIQSCDENFSLTVNSSLIGQWYDYNPSLINYHTTQHLLNNYFDPIELYYLGLPEDSILFKYFQGGFILNLDTINNKVLLIGNEDIGFTNFGCYNQCIPTSQEIGSGQSNTELIMTYCDDQSISAYMCESSNLNGFNDWFLPSYNELKLICNINNNDELNFQDLNLGINNFYSSSSQNTCATSFVVRPSYCNSNSYATKLENILVRPFREYISNNINETQILVNNSGWKYFLGFDSSGCTYLDSVYLNLGICGCTDNIAVNFNSNATIDDGSCSYGIYGCTYSQAVNYNPSANIDDGSCIYISGCTDPNATNYNPSATISDGSCNYEIYGCTYNDAVNYNPYATADDGSCYYIYGCIDILASNYYPDATIDDGSCEYDIPGCTYEFASNYNEEATLDDGSCIIEGCDDPNALNYDGSVNYNDGSCEYIFGCTDNNALNFNQEATFDDNSCIYEVIGCLDVNACNYNEEANTDDGSCTYLEVEYTINNNSCPNDEVGYIFVSPLSGIAPYSYSWSNGGNNSFLMNLSSGEYILNLTDDSGCQLTDTIVLEQPVSELQDITPEICYLTVDDATGKNKIVLNPIQLETIGGYIISKEVLTGVYQDIATLDANTLEYVDENSNPLVNSNRYKVRALDNCLTESQNSQYHQTVHLSMNVGLNSSVNLDWDQYEGFEVSSYMVFRGESVNDLDFIGFVSGNTTSYSDLAPPVGTSIYQVRVVAPICNPISSDPNANFALVADTLKSNIVEHDYVEENNDLGANVVINNPSCDSCNDGSIVANAFGGTPTYTYSWTNGITTNYNFNLSQGDYTLYVFDSQGGIYSQTITLTAESSVVLGCTDFEATNYNADATEDDGSCEYPVVDNPCDITPSGLFVDNIIHERVAFNWSAPSSAPSYYMIRYRPVGTSSWTVMSAGSQNDIPFTGTSRTRYFMEPGTTYQWNIRARVVDENGATVCQSPWSASHQYTTLPACANLIDLYVNSEANLVYFNASKPSGEWGIWQAKGKIREVGSNNYRYLATTVDNYTNQIKYNFTPSTDYEWHTKAWCTGNVDEDGNSDPQYHSGWGEFSAFTTQDPCDKLPTNLSTSSGNNANTAITMSWDIPNSGQPHHYFLELTNETTGQVFSWNNLAGSSTSKTKYGQSSGDQFKWRIRGACGENGTSWATPFTSYEYYTLGGDRLGNDSQLNSQLTNISVYPNPSRGEFNISFDLEIRQNVYLSITNYLGEVIFTKELKDQEGQYNKTIDLGNKANGIYMLKITTNNQNINQKIVIQ